MSLYDRDASKHQGSPADAEPPVSAVPAPPVSAPTGSYSEAEDSSAHIAELVRRSTERRAGPGPSSIARPEVMAANPPTMAMATQPPTPARPVAQRVEEPAAGPPRPALRQPSRRLLAVAGAVAVVLVAGGFALSASNGSGGEPPLTRGVSTPRSVPTPAGYAVKLSDVITDCQGHSHGRTKSSFKAENCVRATRSVATGRVNGRPVLFVGSRIQMRSVEAAAAVKQVLDDTGTGNLNDLLREGKTFAGAPAKMPASGYASVQSGAYVVVAETGFIDGGSSSSRTPALRAAAAQVAALITAQG